MTFSPVMLSYQISISLSAVVAGTVITFAEFKQIEPEIRIKKKLFVEILNRKDCSFTT